MYLNKILPSTRVVLDELSKMDFMKEFTLVGGTALALYLNHRLSEDLDFCVWDKSGALFDPGKLSQAINANFSVRSEEELSANHIDFYVGDEPVKVSFFCDDQNEALVERNTLLGNVSVSTDKWIAAMKLNVLRHRSKFRDLYDIYALSKKYRVSDMIDWAHEFSPRVNKKYFRLNLLNPDKVNDESIAYLKPEEDISADAIRLYLAEKMRSEKRN